MNYSIATANRATHLNIVAVAFVWAIVVANAAILLA
jgi:hypothetical protein